MRRPAVVFLLVALGLPAMPALAQQSKSRPRSSRPAPLPMPPPPAGTVPVKQAPAPAPEAPAPEASAPTSGSATSGSATSGSTTSGSRAATGSAAAEGEGQVAQRFAVEGFAGGLFALTGTQSVVVSPGGVATVDTRAPPLFRWGARVSSPFYRIDRTASLEWLATLGLSATGFHEELMGMTISGSALNVDVLPGLRARFALLENLSLTGELGIGVQFTRAVTRVTFQGERVDGATAGVFRFALGGRYAVDDKFSLFFEPVGLHAYVGHGTAVGWSLQAGFAYAL